jgi:hypothetical protein
MLVSQRMPLTAPSNVDRPRPVRNQSSLYLLAVPGAATAYLYHSIHVGLLGFGKKGCRCQASAAANRTLVHGVWGVFAHLQVVPQVRDGRGERGVSLEEQQPAERRV